MGDPPKAWMTLKAMQLARQPLVVETRLQTYQNMLIEELSAPDDVKTLNALKTTARLREIIVADVAETKTIILAVPMLSIRP
ncbi:phage baseplate protein [Sporomusa aerivorans]|uniref:phage baseplate protein n=1 Tax=Sporomusa aerivorans TaxID=204936 RepID=UPI00352A2FE1